MIEIVYDEDQDKLDTTRRNKYDLPKNIRQVGNAPGNYKIYVEDYVMTYLRKIAAPGNMTCRGAILLGKVYHQDGEKVLFISGAVDAQNMEFDISMIDFNDNVWSGLYSEINKYFNDLDIVGWFLSRMGFSTNINEQMKKLHRENFPGGDKVLFLMDSLECDETFYYCENGSMVREKGYYIYYVRNEKMQNYIISRKTGEVETNRDAVIIKDKTVVETFREKESHRSDGKGYIKRSRLRTVVGIGTLCAISIGSVWCISPSTLDSLKNAVLHRDGREIQVFMNSADADEKGINASTSVQSNKVDELNDVQNGKNEKDEKNEDNSLAGIMTTTSSVMPDATDANNDATESPLDMSVDMQYFTYTVETGDTLVSIAIQMYGDQTKAEYIARVNDLDMDTPIYEGQKIIIPYTQ